MNYLAKKTSRNNFNEGNTELEKYSLPEEVIFHKQPINKKTFKTIQVIKDETIEEYNKLNHDEKLNNEILLKLIEKFDIIDTINYNLLSNDLNDIKKLKTEKGFQKSGISPNDKFIEDYKNYRYTLLTNQRIEILNEFKKINNNINEINYEYECKEPSILVKEFLLDLIELYEDFCLTKNKLKLKEFIIGLKRYYQIKNII